jgi:flagellar basal body rod protein FlgG
MLNGLYSSATNLDSLSRQQEAIASNLAHLNTPGHRKMFLTFVERPDVVSGVEAARHGMQVEKQSADFSTEGLLQPTGRALDLAIRGEGFFTYQGANEKIYSRDGIVHVNPETNELVNRDGLPLLGGGAPITAPQFADDIVVTPEGSLMMEGQEIGNLDITKFDDNRLLESESQVYFRKGNAIASPSENFRVQQGVRELSNANAVTELVSMIVGSRHFEASQRAIRMISDAIQENTKS